MSAADLVARLAKEGIDPTLLAEVAQELFAGEIERELLAGRREKDRLRQRKSRDVTSCHVTKRDVTDEVSPNKETPQTPKEINPHPCVRGTRARAKHPLPGNWQPAPLKPDGQAGQIVARKPAGWLERQLSKFKDHALQNNRLCSDWDAAWRNWIKQADEMDEQRTNSLGRHKPVDGLSSTARAAVAVFGPPGAGH